MLVLVSTASYMLLEPAIQEEHDELDVKTSEWLHEIGRAHV